MDRFTRISNGYNPKEVDELLNKIIIRLEKNVESNKAKDLEIKKLKEKISLNEETIYKAKKYDELNLELNKAIINAHNSKEKLREIAKQERNLILEDARKNANKVLNDAISKSRMVNYKASLLEKNINEFKMRLKSTLEEQIRFLDDIDYIGKQNRR